MHACNLETPADHVRLTGDDVSSSYDRLTVQLRYRERAPPAFREKRERVPRNASWQKLPRKSKQRTVHKA